MDLQTIPSTSSKNFTKDKKELFVMSLWVQTCCVLYFITQCTLVVRQMERPKLKIIFSQFFFSLEII